MICFKGPPFVSVLLRELIELSDCCKTKGESLLERVICVPLPQCVLEGRQQSVE